MKSHAEAPISAGHTLQQDLNDEESPNEFDLVDDRMIEDDFEEPRGAPAQKPQPVMQP